MVLAGFFTVILGNPEGPGTIIPVYERIFEYIQIFEYFPLNIDIHIRLVAIFKAEYYLNIQIFLYEYFQILVFKNHFNYLN